MLAAVPVVGPLSWSYILQLATKSCSKAQLLTLITVSDGFCRLRALMKKIWRQMTSFKPPLFFDVLAFAPFQPSPGPIALSVVLRGIRYGCRALEQEAQGC